MNFFEHQERARKKTSLLIFYFALAIFLIITAIDLIALGLVLFFKDPNIIHMVSEFDISSASPEPIYITPDLIIKLFIHIAVVISPTIIVIIALGTVFRMLSLTSGGISVAELAGATPLDLDTQDINERKFINIVEEMSIASGIPVPKLYIMRDETAINAFVAGIHPADTVMVVTEGALTQLNRDELQGVIGHEFSHIFNSDMQISVRLIGILAGVLLIGQLGGFILRSLTRSGTSSRSSSSSSKKGGDNLLFIFLLGLGLYIVGYIGLFFGRLIKAGISRQRESLADACSVQFTRNPTGLVGALQKIDQYSKDTILKTAHAEDINHLCFCPSVSIYFTQLLESHPPLKDRITALDPDGIYRLELSKKPIDTKMQPPPKTLNDALPAMYGIIGVQSSIGNPSDAHVDLAISLLHNIPDPIRQASHNPDKIELLYYALILSKDPEKYKVGLEFIKPLLTPENWEEVKSFYAMIALMDSRSKLPLIDISIPTFKTMTPEERRDIFDVLNKLDALDEQDLFEFTLLGIIGKNVEDRTPKELHIKYSNFEQAIPSLETVLSFIIASGNQDEATLDARFDVISKKLTNKTLTRMPVNTLNPQIILPALKDLNLLSPLCKQQLIKASLESIQDDGHITLTEAEVIRGMAACLDCPIPPVIPAV